MQPQSYLKVIRRLLSLMKSWMRYYKNAINFRWSNVQREDEEDIAKANFIESWQKQADLEIFIKSYWRILW